MRIERFLDFIGAAALLGCTWSSDVLTEPSHCLVGMIERQSVRARYLDSFLPRAGVAGGAGDHQSMQHSEIDRALGIEAELPLGQMPAQHQATTGFLPQPAEHQVGADAVPPVRRGRSETARWSGGNGERQR